MAFQQVTAVTPMTSHSYAITLSDDWCIGSVPNGGYVGSVLLSAVRCHFSHTLSKLDQPDTISMQLQFLRRTRTGSGTVTVHDLKLGASISMVQLVLSQDGQDKITGLFSQSNLSKQAGISLPTRFRDDLSPAPPPVNLEMLEKDGEDPNWYFESSPRSKDFRKATKHLMFHHPKQASNMDLVDQWIRFRPGGKDLAVFTQDALGFVVDMFPMIVDQYPEAHDGGKSRWYPTVTLNLDVRKNIDANRPNWLFVRIRSTQIRNGRLDLQVVVLDKDGELVALGSHVTLILSAERNTSNGRPNGGQKQLEKL